MSARFWFAAFLAVAAPVAPVLAQETVDEDAELRTFALTHLPGNAARRAFGTVATASAGDVSVVGEYWKGCYSGGMQLAPAGPHWQVMRLYRNRNWGTPMLVGFLERFAAKASAVTGWPGILVGDMSQPRGGPMLTGHSSHQLGIEADIWLRPMPKRRLRPHEVETLRSTDLLRRDRKDVDPAVYTRAHYELLRTAASDPAVARVFVNAAIKKALCRDAGNEPQKDRAWLAKIRPAIGHSYHFHIRLACPAGQAGCVDQAPPPAGDGCKEALSWLRGTPVEPRSGGLGKTWSVASMPAACRDILSGAPLLEARGGADSPGAIADAIAGTDAGSSGARSSLLRGDPASLVRASRSASQGVD